MTLTVELTSEEEARIDATARAQGLTVDAFVRRALMEIVRSPDQTLKTAIRRSVLPTWSGRVIGSLRREDIYEDVK